MFTLDQIKSFVTVAEELHFGRAAERLNMTQPPLSRQIQKLERSVGVELLHRDNRRVELTAAGAAFLNEAHRLIALSDQAPRMAQKVAAGRAGLLRLGFTATSGFSVLGSLLQEVTARLPEVEAELFEMVSAEQVDALSRGELDVGLARPPFDHDLFNSRPLLSEDLVLAVPEGHPLTQRTGLISVSELRETPFIGHDPLKARYFYDMTVRYLPLEHKNAQHVVSQVLTMISLVAARRGVAFVPESTRRLGIEGVTYLQLADIPRGIVQLHAIWAKDNRNPALQKVLQTWSPPR